MSLFQFRPSRTTLLGVGGPQGDMPDWLQESLKHQVRPSVMSGNDVWRMRMMMDLPESARNALSGGFGNDYTGTAQASGSVEAPLFQNEMPSEEASIHDQDSEQGYQPMPPYGPTPEDVAAALPHSGDTHPIPPNAIPRAYFENQAPSALERAGQYVGESVDAFGRAAANNIVVDSDLGDHVSAAMGAMTGWQGQRGDYQGNLRHQRTNSELAKIKSPAASFVGKGAGALLGGALFKSVPTVQGVIRDVILKDRAPPPPPRRRIPPRFPPKSHKPPRSEL